VSAVSLASPAPATNTKLKLSPLASIRWSDGRILIFTPSHRIISAVDARILTVLHAFARPKTMAELSTELREIPQAFLAIATTLLSEHGVLIQADAPHQRAGADVTTLDVSSLAASIAIVSRTIARDARALGPYLEQERASDHGPDVAPRLEQVRDVLAGVASELHRARPDYLEQ
jgi:hypothetical protein